MPSKTPTQVWEEARTKLNAHLDNLLEGEVTWLSSEVVDLGGRNTESMQDQLNQKRVETAIHLVETFTQVWQLEEVLEATKKALEDFYANLSAAFPQPESETECLSYDSGHFTFDPDAQARLDIERLNENIEREMEIQDLDAIICQVA